MTKDDDINDKVDLNMNGVAQCEFDTVNYVMPTMDALYKIIDKRIEEYMNKNIKVT